MQATKGSATKQITQEMFARQRHMQEKAQNNMIIVRDLTPLQRQARRNRLVNKREGEGRQISKAVINRYIRIGYITYILCDRLLA